MEVWASMMSDMGIDISSEIPQEKKDQILDALRILPNEPDHYDHNDMAVFTTDQLAYGKPENFGFIDDYIVVSGQQTLVLDHNYEMNMDRAKKIHRYSRCERFKFTLNQLCGFSGNVPPKVLSLLSINHDEQHFNSRDSYVLSRISKSKFKIKSTAHTYKDNLDISSISREDIWDHIYKILKSNRLAKYYNRIPAILGLAKYNKGDCKFSKEAYKNIIDDFERMHYIFPKIKHELKRSYFPSLRYVASRLMVKHGVSTDWKITTIKTQHKKKELDGIYDFFWEKIDEEYKEFEDLFN